jgi:SNF2 family DNA or RNA helicase
VAAVKAALSFPGFALTMEQRTGKSPVALEVVARRAPERLLIVCPKIAIGPVWKAHLAARDDIHGEVKIHTYEYVTEHYKQFKRWAPDMVLLDEAHYIKNRTSKRSRRVRIVAKAAKYRLALTGTPIGKRGASGIAEAWALMDFVDPRLFGPWEYFKEKYLIYGGYMGYKLVGTRNVVEFERHFRSRCFRVLLDDQVSATIKERLVYVKLQGESRRVYSELRDEMVTWIEDQLKRVKSISIPLAITRVLRLQQVCGGFVTDHDGVSHAIGYEKLEALGVLLLQLHRPTVVFVRFLDELEIINRLCTRLGLSVTLISGKNPFSEFSTDVAIVQIQSGLAIDLSRANVAIFYSMDRRHAHHEQAKFRIRSYHSLDLEYYYLIAEGTIDEEIYDSAVLKKQFSSFLLSGFRRKTW